MTTIHPVVRTLFNTISNLELTTYVRGRKPSEWTETQHKAFDRAMQEIHTQFKEVCRAAGRNYADVTASIQPPEQKPNA